MYTNPIQNPPAINNPTSLLQSNIIAGASSTGPTGTSSPMQTSIMFRPVSSPFSINNRPAIFDRNKRASYPTDIRPQPTSQSSQSSYGTVMAANPNITPSTVIVGGAGAMKQQKKRKRLTEKVMHRQIRSLIPESQAYIELLRLEQKLDNSLWKKRLDLQEILKRPQKIKKKLRIFISHQYPIRLESDSMTLIDDDLVNYWEMRIEGRLLDDPTTSKYDQGKTKRKFSSFFRSLVIELDEDLYGPDNHLIEWHRTNTTVETDGFQVRRPGEQNVKCKILMVLDHSPPQFRLDTRLAHLLSITHGTRQTIIQALWQYIKTHKLQDSEEREFIHCNAELQSILECTRIRLTDLPSRLNKLLFPAEPIMINHTIYMNPDQRKHICYDIDVEVDDPARDSMRTFLTPQNANALEELDGKIQECIDSINQLKQTREFYLSFANDPQDFIYKWLSSQSRDLKLSNDSSIANNEEERRADYYTEQWSYEAVSRYFHNTIQQKRIELEQALGIRNS